MTVAPLFTSIFRFLLFAGLLFQQATNGHSSQSEGPSFDCQMAKFDDEILICSNSELSRQERRMAAAYEKMKLKIGVQKSQEIGRYWLDIRRECGSDVGCIMNVQRNAWTEYVGKLNAGEQSTEIDVTEVELGKDLINNTRSDNYQKPVGSLDVLNTAPSVSSNGSHLFGVVTIVLMFVGGVYVYYRVVYGARTCPACSAKKAFKIVDSFDEMKSTFVRRERSGFYEFDGSGRSNPVYADYSYEAGVRHTTRQCNKCSFTRKDRDSYSKRI